MSSSTISNLSWVAEYSDGRVIAEKDKQLSYVDLDRNLLKSLKLVDEKGKVKAEVTSTNGEVLFYRIRTVTTLGGVFVNRVYYLGWRKRENGSIKMHVTALSPTGDSVECKQFTNDDWWQGETV